MPACKQAPFCRVEIQEVVTAQLALTSTGDGSLSVAVWVYLYAVLDQTAIQINEFA